MLKKEITIPIYGITFTVIFYDSDDELKKEFAGKYQDFEHSVEGFDAALIDLDDKIYLVFSTEKENAPTPGVIAHEAKHIVNNIFQSIGHNLCIYNDEPECYLLGWIVDEIHKFKDEMNVIVM